MNNFMGDQYHTFTNKNLTKQNFTQSTLGKFEKCDLSGSCMMQTFGAGIFNRCNLDDILGQYSNWNIGAEIRDCTISNLNLEHSILKSLVLHTCKGKQVNLSHCNLVDTKVEGGELPQLNLCHSKVNLGVFRDTQAKHLQAVDTSLKEITVSNCNFEDSVITGDLRSSLFEKCNLRRGQITGNLSGSTWEDVGLSYSSLNNVNLACTLFADCDFTNAKISLATMDRTVFYNCFFTGTKFIDIESRGPCIFHFCQNPPPPDSWENTFIID